MVQKDCKGQTMSRWIIRPLTLRSIVKGAGNDVKIDAIKATHAQCLAKGGQRAV